MLKANTDDPKVQQAIFLAAYGVNANVSESIKIAGVSRRAFNRWKEDDTDFLIEFGYAQKAACDALEAEARTRATLGVGKMKFHQGRPIMVPDPLGRTVLEPKLDFDPESELVEKPLMVPYIEYEKSDQLLMFLIRANDPGKYGNTPLPGEGVPTKTYVELTISSLGAGSSPVPCEGGGEGPMGI